MNKQTSDALCLLLLGAFFCQESTAAKEQNLAPQPECIHLFRGIRPVCVGLSPCEKYLAAGGYQASTDAADSLLVVWDLQTKKEVFRYANQNGCFNAIAFSPKGNQIAAVGVAAEKGPKVWGFPSGKLRASLDNEANSTRSLSYSPDGDSLVIATLLEKQGCDGIIAWDTEHFHKHFVLTGGTTTTSMAFTPDGKTIACGNAFGRVQFWTFAAGEIPTELQVDQDGVGCIRFGRSRNLLVVGTNGSELRSGEGSFPSGRGGRLAVFSDWRRPEKPPTLWRAHQDGVVSLLIGPEDKWVFAGGSEGPAGKTSPSPGVVQIWDIDQKRLHAKIVAHTAPVRTMALSRNGDILVTAAMDETVKVWSIPKAFYGKRAP